MVIHKEAPKTILMLPWLAHGHISPFFELAKKLSHKNFHIYICSTPILLQSIKKKITQKYANSIHLVPYHIPPSPKLPLHYHTTNGLPSHLMDTLKNEYEKSSSQFPAILSEIKPHLVIYDFIQPWAADMAASQDIPAVQFFTIAACVLAYTVFMMQNPHGKFPFPEIYLRGNEGMMIQKEQEDVDTDVNQTEEKDKFMQAEKKSCNILLVKSCREIEGKYIDALSSISGKKVVPTGPLIIDSSFEKDDKQSEIIRFLDKTEESSVLFVSFGSEYFLTKDERYEIARGLEQSEVNFIWVIRFPGGDKKITIEEALPEGFLERVKNRGMVVEGWAPQAKILKHKNTGGFLSHCGWNSVLESMTYGVPIVAMPIQIDQPLNARLVEALGVGVEAVKDEEGKIQSIETARAIRKVMVEEESRKDVRKKVNELKKKLACKKDEEIDDLVEEIKNLCNKVNNQSFW